MTETTTPGAAEPPEDRIAAALRTISFEVIRARAEATQRVEAAEARTESLLRAGRALRLATKAYMSNLSQRDLIDLVQKIDEFDQAAGGAPQVRP